MIRTFHKLIEYFLGASVQNYPNFPRIAANAGWLLADNMVRIGVGFFVTTWMIRYLTTLEQSAALIKHSRLFIGTDSVALSPIFRYV